MRKKLVLFIMFFITLLLTACGQSGQSQVEGDSYEQVDIPEKDYPVATIEMESGEQIIVELYPEIAPKTVENFIKLANAEFYHGLTFHRVIPDFMIQGGDPNGDGSGGPGYSIEGEFDSNGIENPLKHKEGVISMARSKDPDSAGSQFFIMVGDSPHLDGEYAAFGQVISGLDVAKEISEVPRGNNDLPDEPQVIKEISIEMP
ncbi:peptidylprolyl isomerase [Gracilibacillus marinus]|jgi:peptidyl-prolyl cis-trans isomerase B (cyclophilin B)|uniref:Peptidyl-prolyl cis-trans isomerase n=1 Tax=Gracilibacillus marinus TaxID=630535 RepID=A0ABV8VP79_9BACI